MRTNTIKHLKLWCKDSGLIINLHGGATLSALHNNHATTTTEVLSSLDLEAFFFS
jgi:hypothetical protein